MEQCLLSPIEWKENSQRNSGKNFNETLLIPCPSPDQDSLF